MRRKNDTHAGDEEWTMRRWREVMAMRSGFGRRGEPRGDTAKNTKSVCEKIQKD